MWDIIKHGDVEERNDRMTLATIYQAVSEDVLLISREGLGKGSIGGTANNAFGCETCQGSKGGDLEE